MYGVPCLNASGSKVAFIGYLRTYQLDAKVVCYLSELAIRVTLSETQGMIKEHVKLSEADREQLQHLIAQEKVSIKVFRRAKALLLLDQGQTLQQAAATVGVDYNAVAKWRNRYGSEGLAGLQDKPRSGRPIGIAGVQRAQITALACSAAPTGRCGC
jgi:transposase-like protein